MVLAMTNLATGSRLFVTLRQSNAAAAELVVTRDGVVTVHPLSFDQVKLLAIQAVQAACS
jgi:hypothetical protein